MLATLTLAALLFAAQVAAYHFVNRALKRRAAYKRRLASLYVAPFVQRSIAPHAHNRPGEN